MTDKIHKAFLIRDLCNRKLVDEEGEVIEDFGISRSDRGKGGFRSNFLLSWRSFRQRERGPDRKEPRA